jgi:hypothetical protein
VSAKTRTLGRIVASVQRRNDGSRRSSGIGRTVRRTTTRCEMSCSTLRVERVPDSKARYRRSATTMSRSWAVYEQPGTCRAVGRTSSIQTPTWSGAIKPWRGTSMR